MFTDARFTQSSYDVSGCWWYKYELAEIPGLLKLTRTNLEEGGKMSLETKCPGF